MPVSEQKSKTALLVGVLLALVICSAAVIAAFRLDDWSRASILSSQGKGWKKSENYKVVGAISKYGDWPQLMLAGGVGLLVAWRLRNREWQRIIIAAMVASTLAGIIANASRLTTGRTRPRESPKIEQGWYGPYHDGKLTIGNSKYNSFPSGHTATAVGFAAVFLFARPLIGLLMMLGAGTVAWSRMALGAHHLSDVIVATILALAVAYLVWTVARRDGDAIAGWAIARLRRKPAAE